MVAGAWSHGVIKDRNSSKGISPAVASILLVALTVVAVGSIAAVLTSFGPLIPPPSAMISITQITAPAYGESGIQDNLTTLF